MLTEEKKPVRLKLGDAIVWQKATGRVMALRNMQAGQSSRLFWGNEDNKSQLVVPHASAFQSLAIMIADVLNLKAEEYEAGNPQEYAGYKLVGKNR